MFLTVAWIGKLFFLHKLLSYVTFLHNKSFVSVTLSKVYFNESIQ